MSFARRQCEGMTMHHELVSQQYEHRTDLRSSLALQLGMLKIWAKEMYPMEVTVTPEALLVRGGGAARRGIPSTALSLPSASTPPGSLPLFSTLLPTCTHVINSQHAFCGGDLCQL